MPTLKTIREVAKLGVLSETHLRTMLKEGKLPGIYSGTRFYVNLEALMDFIQRESSRIPAEENSGKM